jgi:hypothetical protein
VSTSKFVRIYRRAMGRVLAPLGFGRTAGCFWRQRDSILHLLALHRGESDFTLDVAVQPLVVPFEAFILTLGGRIYELGPGVPFRW